MSTSIGIGNLNIEPVELNSSALNVHNRPSIDNSLITGNDIYIHQMEVLQKMVRTNLFLTVIHHSIKF